MIFFFSNLDLGFNTVSIVKTTSKKLGALMRSLKLLSPEIVPYSCKLTIRNICSDARNFCFEGLHELLMDIWTACSIFATSLERLTKHQNVSSLTVV